MALGDFPCKPRANTQEFSNRYKHAFPTGMKKAYCPHCDVAVSGSDKECWKCKRSLTGVALKSLNI